MAEPTHSCEAARVLTDCFVLLRRTTSALLEVVGTTWLQISCALIRLLIPISLCGLT